VKNSIVIISNRLTIYNVVEYNKWVLKLPDCAKAVCLSVAPRGTVSVESLWMKQSSAGNLQITPKWWTVKENATSATIDRCPGLSVFNWPGTGVSGWQLPANLRRSHAPTSIHRHSNVWHSTFHLFGPWDRCDLWHFC